MSDVVLVALFAAIPPTLLAIATLIAVIRGLIKISSLHDLVDGKFSEMLQLTRASSKVEGRVDTLERTLPSTAIINDRRKE